MFAAIRRHIFLIFGLFCLGISIMLLTSSLGASERCTEKTTAVLVTYSIDYEASNNSTAYYPVLGYSVKGINIEAVSDIGTGNTPYNLGEELEIRYNPDNPYEFVIEGNNTKLHFGIYVGIVAVICFAIEILSAFGVISRNMTTKKYYHPNHGNGVSVDITGIAQIGSMISFLKNKGKQFNELSDEDKKILMDVIENSNNCDHEEEEEE